MQIRGDRIGKEALLHSRHCHVPIEAPCAETDIEDNPSFAPGKHGGIHFAAGEQFLSMARVAVHVDVASPEFVEKQRG